MLKKIIESGQETNNNGQAAKGVWRLLVWYHINNDSQGNGHVTKRLTMQVSEIMTSQVQTTAPDDSIQQAARLMSYRQFTGLPVVDKEKKVVGIITEYDLMSQESKIHIPTYIQFLDKLGQAKVAELERQAQAIRSVQVKDVMTRNVVSVKADADVRQVAKLFTQQHINPIPIIDDSNKLVGIVSRTDVIKLFT